MTSFKSGTNLAEAVRQSPPPKQGVHTGDGGLSVSLRGSRGLASSWVSTALRTTHGELSRVCTQAVTDFRRPLGVKALDTLEAVPGTSSSAFAVVATVVRLRGHASWNGFSRRYLNNKLYAAISKRPPAVFGTTAR